MFHIIIRNAILEMVIRSDKEVEKKYFSVEELGCILKTLRESIKGKDFHELK